MHLNICQQKISSPSPRPPASTHLLAPLGLSGMDTQEMGSRLFESDYFTCMGSNFNVGEYVNNINIVADSINMASFQQKLLLKGSEESIEYFTRILKQVKDKAGYNTATAIIEALDHWGSYGTTAAKCEALER